LAHLPVVLDQRVSILGHAALRQRVGSLQWSCLSS
jgi:hypothetical protein